MILLIAIAIKQCPDWGNIKQTGVYKYVARVKEQRQTVRHRRTQWSSNVNKKEGVSCYTDAYEMIFNCVIPIGEL